MNVKGYYENVDQLPWGKMFYDLVWQQLAPYHVHGWQIFDFGSGFGKTSNYLAAENTVVAYEPNLDVLALRYQENAYVQLTGNWIEFMSQLSGNTTKFDLIMIHNTFEYTSTRKDILLELIKHQNTNGLVSIIKHNRLGRVMGTAVLHDNPAEALRELHGGAGASVNFGAIQTYENSELVLEMIALGYELVETLGIRSFYALSQNDTIKYNEQWYQNMLRLEREVERQPAFIQVAFFNHLIFRKK